MIDKKSYKLLTRLYRAGHLSCSAVEAITGCSDDEHHIDPYISGLMKYGLIEYMASPPDESGCFQAVGYEISLSGRAFVEHRRRAFWGFFLPYAITTLIAVASLVTSIAANWDTILVWLRLLQNQGT